MANNVEQQLADGYQKVADALAELIRSKNVPEKTVEGNLLTYTHNRFKDKADVLRMVAQKPKTDK